MGRVRRGGYTFIWWIGDRPPRHVHVFDKNGRLLTRVNLETMRAIDTPGVSEKIMDIIRALRRERRL